MSGYESTIRALVAAIDAKDPYTRGHSQRVMEYVLLGASTCSFTQEELQAVEFGALLHDIGKIGIDDGILRKSDCLTSEEWLVIRRHPQIGANIIGEVSFLDKAREVILHHHERYDGAGYPGGLKGEQIPMGARLVAVADTFDTMTSDRPYRPALNAVDALMTLAELAGTQFCPRAVAALVSVLEKHREELTTKSRARALQLPAFS